MLANTRMYNVNPAAEAAWSALVAWVSRDSGVSVDMHAHPAPKPVEELWARPDLGLVMMCGWPFYRATPQPVAIAAPILDHPLTEGAPVYWTDLIVAASSSIDTLEDSFGGVMAWTVKGSHSGYNAPRYLLSAFAKTHGARLFKSVEGPVVTPRGAIESVLSGRAELAPLDGFYHLLLQRFEPQTAAALRVVARTPNAPIPLFTASHGADLVAVQALRASLQRAETDPGGRSLLAELGIRAFTTVERSTYAIGDQWQAEAIAAGYPEVQ